MNLFRDKDLEHRLNELEVEVRALRVKCEYLEHAATMRVGELDGPTSVYHADRRPVMTAMVAIQKLMADAGIEPHYVPNRPATFEFVQAKKEEA